MNRMTETEQYLGLGTEYEFDGEKYIIKSLGVTAYGYALKITNALMPLRAKVQKGEKPSDEEFMNILCTNDVALDSITKMVSKTLREQLFPGKTDDEVAPFATRNMMGLIKAVFKENMPQQSQDNTEKMNRLKSFRESRKNDKPAKQDKV